MPEPTTSAMRGLHSLPAVDERLVMPESGFEIIDGKVVEVSPAHEPHGSCHSKLAALLEAHVGAEYNTAIDMLTRTSAIDDFAPDGSIYPAARDPETGGRQLEELAFEVVSTESLGHAGRKAAKLIQRGVRRVFAIDVERERVLEWSVGTECWEILADDAAIEDPALGVPLSIHDLVGVTSTDDAVARALLAKGNPVLAHVIDHERARARKQGRASGRAEGRAQGRAEGRVEGKAEAVIAFLVARGIPPTDEQRRVILEARDPATIDRWLASVGSCSSVSALLD